jgi:hypothetical protein
MILFKPQLKIHQIKILAFLMLTQINYLIKFLILLTLMDNKIKIQI